MKNTNPNDSNLSSPPVFDFALSWIFEAEGDFSDDPDDPGGATQYGISLRYLQAHNMDLNHDGRVDKMDARLVTVGVAIGVYQDFWSRCRCDELHPMIAIAVFDAAVNTGVSAGIKVLQRACRVKADGLLGTRTLAAVHRYQPQELLNQIMSRRAHYYHRIAVKNPLLKKFMNGWFNRIFRLHTLLLTHQTTLERDYV